MSLVYFACFLTLLTTNEAARILAVVPAPSISHQVVFRPIVQELAKRGHEVVIVTTDPAFPKGHAPDNLTEIDLHDLSYKLWREEFVPASSAGDRDLFTLVKLAFEIINGVFYEQLQTAEFQYIISNKSKPFDLLLIESVVRPALVLTHIMKVPAIQISSLGALTFNYEALGAPIHPILYPQFFRQRIYNLTFWEKLTELYKFYEYVQYFSSSEATENEQLKQIFGPDTPEVSELSNNVDMLFLNINPIWEGNQPVPPSVKYMGGLHQTPRKQLPEDLQIYLDSSKNGVIYMSFGTNISPSQLPSELVKIFLNVFSKLPYDVLWKWDKDHLPVKPSNVRIHKWFPQSDLLRHPKVKLFITQGGLQSTDEAITAEVPMIGIPMLGDQWYNAEKYEHHGIGIKIEKSTLTEERLSNAINTIISDESYRENIKRLHTLMTDQPIKPLDRVIWWIEYVLRHGGAKHLRAPAANISWAEYLELEFIALLLLLLSILVLFISISLYYIVIFFKKYSVNDKMKNC